MLLRCLYRGAIALLLSRAPHLSGPQTASIWARQCAAYRKWKAEKDCLASGLRVRPPGQPCLQCRGREG